MSDYYTDPETGIVYWRDEHGVLRPRVLTDTKGEVVGYEQAAGFFPDRVAEVVHDWNRPADPVVSPADTPRPDELCPECKGHGFHHVERHAQVCGTFEDEETQANFCHANCSIEDVPCRVCKGTGRLVGVPRAVYMARGGAAPVQLRGYA